MTIGNTWEELLANWTTEEILDYAAGKRLAAQAEESYSPEGAAENIQKAERLEEIAKARQEA